MGRKLLLAVAIVLSAASPARSEPYNTCSEPYQPSIPYDFDDEDDFAFHRIRVQSYVAEAEQYSECLEGLVQDIREA